jgi:hypothetical protein
MTSKTPRANVTIRFSSDELETLDKIVRWFAADGFDFGRADVVRLLVKRAAASRAATAKPAIKRLGKRGGR